MVKYGQTKRARASALFDAKWSCSCVAKQVGVPLATAKKWRKAWKSDPALFLRGPRHHKRGNPHANRVSPPLTKLDRTKIVAFVREQAGVKSNRRRGMRKLSRDIAREPYKIEVSPNTMSAICREAGGEQQHPQRKPVYTVAQRRKRVRCSKERLEDDWSSTLASDEVEVTLDGKINQHNNLVWVFPGEQAPVQRRNKFPSALKYFIGISKGGAMDPVEFQGTLNNVSYQQLLENALPQANALFGGHEWRFLHDGASYHTAASTQEYLESHTPFFFTKDQWAVFPDANPAESIFSEMQDSIAKAAPRNLAELDVEFRRAFREATTAEKLNNLFDNASMRRRFEAIIAAKGHKTKY